MPFGSVFGLNQRFVDVSRLEPASRRPWVSLPGQPLRAPDAPEISNVERFRQAISGRVTEPPADVAGATKLFTYRRYGEGLGALSGGILYLPPGRYLIENEPPEAWRENLWEKYLSGNQSSDLRNYGNTDRAENPFGASLHVPRDVTLWMAAGAVLVPSRDAIISIEGPLVCEPVQVFDLSLGGLVVFGTRVPRLLPQWWHDPEEVDHSSAIQAAIDAGVHNRSIIWEAPSYPGGGGPALYNPVLVSLPAIPIELRGGYSLRETVSVRGNSLTNRVLEIHRHRAVRRQPPTDADPTIYLDPSNTDGFYIPVRYGDPLISATSVTVSSEAVSATLGDGNYTILVKANRASSPGVTSVTMKVVLSDLGGGSTVIVTVVLERPVRITRQIPGVVPNVVIEGSNHGRAGRGARLVAARPFRVRHVAADLGESLVLLSGAMGLTLRNIEFDVTALRGVSCLDVMPTIPPRQMQGAAVRSCSFKGGGTGTTLVRLGPPPRDVRYPPDDQPSAEPSDYGSDMSGLAFDDCEFSPMRGATGVMVRTNESLPIRLRHCDLIGEAVAMISSFGGALFLDGCQFDNNPPPPDPTTPSPPGFESPDGADIYLNNEPPWRSPVGRPIPQPGAFTCGMTVTGCVSRSPRFLSSATPFLADDSIVPTRPGNFQRQLWPVLLLNVRHIPPATRGAVSVRWGRMNGAGDHTVVQIRAQNESALGMGCSLVILGGQYRGAFQALRGSIHPVAIAARNAAGGLMDIQIVDAYPGRNQWTVVTEVFGLRYEQSFVGP